LIHNRWPSLRRWRRHKLRRCARARTDDWYATSNRIRTVLGDTEKAPLPELPLITRSRTKAIVFGLAASERTRSFKLRVVAVQGRGWKRLRRRLIRLLSAGWGTAFRD